STDGALQWAKRAGGVEDDTARGVVLDSAGNAYVTGFFEGSATFGRSEPNETTLSAAFSGVNSDDVFLAKFSPAGALVWARGDGGASNDQGLAIAGGGGRGVFVVGGFATSATFGAGEANQTILASANSIDMFVAKYQTSAPFTDPVLSPGFSLIQAFYVI